MALQWFSYTGSDPADPTHYTFVGATPPTCSSPSEQLCAIRAEDNGGEPDLDITIALEMVQALQNQSDTANVRLKDR